MENPTSFIDTEPEQILPFEIEFSGKKKYCKANTQCQILFDCFESIPSVMWEKCSLNHE